MSTTVHGATEVITPRPPLEISDVSWAMCSPCATPTVRIATSAITPRVSSVTSAIARSMVLTEWVAPKNSARSRLDATGSTAMIVCAPASFAPWIAPVPMPPMPTTTTVSPGWTLPMCTADPHPVVTPHPTSAALSSGMSFSILITEVSCTTQCSANVPSRDMAPRS